MSTIDSIRGEKGGVGKSVRATVNDPTVGADTFTRMDRHRIKEWLQATHDRFAPAFAFAD